MADPATILVRRQFFDVDMHGTESDGIALQQRLPEMCSRVLAPALEAAFAKADPGDAHLCIERLDVDLGRISLGGLDDGLAVAVRIAVAEFLRSNLPAPVATDASGAPLGWPAGGNVRRRETRETVDDALLVFLRTGRLPWAFQLAADEQFEAVVLRAWSGAGVSRGPPSLATRNRLLGLLAEAPARARLLMQFSPAFAMTMMRHVSPNSAAMIEACLRALGPGAHSSSPEYLPFVRRLWDVVLTAANNRRLGPRAVVGAAWRALPQDQRGRSLVSALELHWPGVTGPQAGSDAQDDQATRSEPSADAGSTARPPLPQVRSAPDTSILAAVGDDAGGLVVANAGLVLLHPFLPRFFQGLGIAEGDELVDHGRAVCVLHHLATGELVAPEHELTLAKVLCNVALDEPVEADVGINPAEIDETIALLEAAIRHWEALRNTSAAGLRGEFLMRTGLLSIDDDGWLLRVETRSVDVLIDQLPWGVSMIKLPWMHSMLRVEWR